MGPTYGEREVNWEGADRLLVTVFGGGVKMDFLCFNAPRRGSWPMGQAHERERGEGTADRLTGQGRARSTPRGQPRQMRREKGNREPHRTASNARRNPANGGDTKGAASTGG